MIYNELNEDDGICLTSAVFLGGLCGCGRMAALEKGRRLAPVQKHLHGVVCDGAHLWSDQRRHHGHLHLRHPLSTRLHPEQGRRKKPLRRTERRRRRDGRPKYIAYLKPTTLEERRKTNVWNDLRLGPVVLGCIIFKLEFAVCSIWATLLPAGRLHFFVLTCFFISHRSVTS